MNYFQTGLTVIGALALLLIIWVVRGWWDARQQTLLPRMYDALIALSTEIGRLEQSDPATVAAQQIQKASLEAKANAAKDAVAKLQV